MRIVAKKGNIVDSGAGAIVNAGNCELWLGSGVAGAIRAKAPDLQRTLNFIRQSRGDCPLGGVVVTPAPNMLAKYVIHAAVMHCRGPLKAQTNLHIVELATMEALLEVRRLGVNGVAFPIFGTGVGGLDLAESTETMVRVTAEVAPSDIMVRFYGYTQEEYAVVREIINHYRKNHA